MLIKDLNVNGSYSFDTSHPTELGLFKDVKLLAKEVNSSVAIQIDPTIANTLALLHSVDNNISTNIEDHIYIYVQHINDSNQLLPVDVIDLNSITVSTALSTLTVTIQGITTSDRNIIQNALVSMGYNQLSLKMS